MRWGGGRYFARPNLKRAWAPLPRGGEALLIVHLEETRIRIDVV
jgi:hypothetical protein